MEAAHQSRRWYIVQAFLSSYVTLAKAPAPGIDFLERGSYVSSLFVQAVKEIYARAKHPALFVVGLLLIAISLGLGPVPLDFDVVAFFTSGRFLTFGVGVIGIYFALVHAKHRYVPLSVVRSNIELIYETPHGDRVLVTDSADLRAHSAAAKGIFQEVYSDGSIPATAIECSVSHSNSHLFKYDRGHSRHWELFQVFDDPLPRGWFKTETVNRTSTVLHLNGFTSTNEWFEIQSPRYPRKRITVTITFHAENPPVKEDCSAITISPNHAITTLHIRWLTQQADHRERLVVYIPSSFNERQRIIWRVRGVRSVR